MTCPQPTPDTKCYCTSPATTIVTINGTACRLCDSCAAKLVRRAPFLARPGTEWTQCRLDLTPPPPPAVTLTLLS